MTEHQETTPTTQGTAITQLECVICYRQSPTLAVNVVTGVCDGCAEVVNRKAMR
ncbi:hypothetical protein [Williamsia sp. DF01-3]|uniref:hypothetical protein n=1 Tax=Williamsia sp. DF01-3 TaxID=2934157 RepID=UPI001FF285D2|nr:hypothetical protein [Williamsia sp. DF01-3]MCK0517905.1 hypothetical protein [Williamsia sp. DF01-3]